MLAKSDTKLDTSRYSISSICQADWRISSKHLSRARRRLTFRKQKAAPNSDPPNAVLEQLEITRYSSAPDLYTEFSPYLWSTPWPQQPLPAHLARRGSHNRGIANTIGHLRAASRSGFTKICHRQFWSKSFFGLVKTAGGGE